MARVGSDPGQGRDAVVYGLTQRGFFSEINVLVCNVAFAMVAGEDLYLDDSRFLTPWGDVLEATLPMIAELRAELHRRIVISHPKADKAVWNERLKAVKRGCDEGAVVAVPDIGFEGGWVQLLARVSAQVFVPRPENVAAADRVQAELGLEGPFAAVHMRRGDKTAGYHKRNGQFRVEGRAAPFDLYVETLSVLAPGVRRIFVLSDDYREVIEAQARHPELELVTLCRPDETGYFHSDFLALSRKERLQAIRRLIVEVLIAVRSAAFAGLYRSNVSLMVAALHQHPERCASVDQATSWTPMT
jgi:hypothetical protein